MLLFRLHGERLFPFINRFKKKPEQGTCCVGHCRMLRQEGRLSTCWRWHFLWNCRRRLGGGQGSQRNSLGREGRREGGTNQSHLFPLLGPPLNRTHHMPLCKSNVVTELNSVLHSQEGRGVPIILRVFVPRQLQSFRETGDVSSSPPECSGTDGMEGGQSGAEGFLSQTQTGTPLTGL